MSRVDNLEMCWLFQSKQSQSSDHVMKSRVIYSCHTFIFTHSQEEIKLKDWTSNNRIQQCHQEHSRHMNLTFFCFIIVMTFHNRRHPLPLSTALWICRLTHAQSLLSLRWRVLNPQLTSHGSRSIQRRAIRRILFRLFDHVFGYF